MSKAFCFIELAKRSQIMECHQVVTSKSWYLFPICLLIQKLSNKTKLVPFPLIPAFLQQMVERRTCELMTPVKLQARTAAILPGVIVSKFNLRTWRHKTEYMMLITLIHKRRFSMYKIYRHCSFTYHTVHPMHNRTP